jgi:hypothetical protein
MADDYWFGVQTSEPLVVRSPSNMFMLDAVYDPGPLSDLDGLPTVVIRGYLFDEPDTEILGALKGSGLRTDCRTEAEGQNDGLGACEERYACYLRDRAARLSELSTDAFELLLWRRRIRSGPPSLSTAARSLFWAELPSQAGDLTASDLSWRQVPTGEITLRLPDIDSLDLRPEVGPQLSAMLDSGVRAPLGHVLFREAWRVRESNLRSALVIAVAAAETGIKEYVANVAPDAAWLMENLQSPPLTKILTEYLPTLPSRRDDTVLVPAVPSEWRSTLYRAVEARNKVVHGRVVKLDREQVEVILQTTFDLLCFLDYHCGQDWAWPTRS